MCAQPVWRGKPVDYLASPRSTPAAVRARPSLPARAGDARSRRETTAVAMTKKQKTALLGHVSLFSEVGPKALGEIAALMTEIEFAPERYIVRQGQVGTGFYLIAAGQARVTRGNAVIARLGPGDFSVSSLSSTKPLAWPTSSPSSQPPAWLWRPGTWRNSLKKIPN